MRKSNYTLVIDRADLEDRGALTLDEAQAWAAAMKAPAAILDCFENETSRTIMWGISFDSRVWTGRSGRKPGLKVFLYGLYYSLIGWIAMKKLNSIFAAYDYDGSYDHA